MPANEIYNQIIHTTKDIKPDAIKIGMLHSTQVIDKVNKSLKKNKYKKNCFRSCNDSKRWF